LTTNVAVFVNWNSAVDQVITHLKTTTILGGVHLNLNMISRAVGLTSESAKCFALLYFGDFVDHEFSNYYEGFECL